MLLELMMNDGVMHIVGTDHIIDISPVKDVKNNEIHCQIITDGYIFLTYKPYGEIRKIFIEAMEEGEFIPYTFDPLLDGNG